VDDMFDVALSKFDDDDTLELAPDDPALAGPTKTDAFNDIFDEFLHENSRVSVMELDTVLNKKRPSEAPELIPAPLKSPETVKPEAEEGSESDSDDSTEDWKKQLTDTLSFTVKEGGWDCESIISTYSNTENHPSTIAIPRKEDKIALGLRGAPKLPHKLQEKSDSEEEKVNLGEGRQKTETAEEKRARKNEVKAMRREHRQEKKSNRTTFREEEVKQRKQNATNFTRGKTVVQYTI